MCRPGELVHDRLADAAEVAQVVAFLCGPPSGYIQGALLDLSGGR
jgi:NAD(P)-dependent dehydrogenase (short-subunit alcohol dehydrogenase family)